MQCDVCEQKKIAVHECDICKGRNCKQCGSLTSSEVRVLELNSRVLKFYCKKCRAQETLPLLQELIGCKNELVDTKDKVVATKDRLILNLEEQIMTLKKEIEEVKNEKNLIAEGNQQSHIKYSEIVGKKTDEVLIVKPKKAQESSITKTLIEESVDLVSLKAGVSRMKTLKDGAVAISCEKQDDLTNVSNSIKKKLGTEYEVKIPEKKFPKIKLINVEEKLLQDENDFIEKIIQQNAITTNDSERKIKFLAHYKNRNENNKETVIMEVDCKTYSQIRKKDKLCIGWKSYKFYDHINVVQCFKCYKFGHMSKECRSDKNVCPKCTGDHKTEECRSLQIICTNCEYAATTLKVPNIDFKHHAYDRKCEAYKRIYRELEKKVYYDLYPSQR